MSVGDTERGAVEIRVHGIGDHESVSALGQGAPLGTPRLLADEQGHPDTETAAGFAASEPPPLPDHPLVLVTWSRTSRRVTRGLWYLALPYTLINVAGHMDPPDTVGALRRRAHAMACIVAGLAASIALTVWLMALIETITKYTPWVNERGNQLALLTVSSVLAARTVTHHRKVIAEQRAQDAICTQVRGLAWWHATAVLVFGAAVAWRLPAQRLQVMPAGCRTYMTCVALRDPAFLVVLATTLSVVACAIVVAACGRHRSTGDQPPTAAGLGAAVVLVAAIALVHGAGSYVRLALDWLLLYLKLRFVPPFSDGPIERVPGLDASDRALLAALPGAEGTYPVDTVGSFAVAGLVALVAIWLVLGRMHRDPTAPLPRDASAKLRRSIRRHSVVASLPSVLPALLVGAGLIYVALVFGTVRAFNRPETFAYFLVVALTHLLAPIAIVVALLGRFMPTLRSHLARIADVSGFWPVVWHPLGGRSYRNDVLEGLTALIERHRWSHIALVGHSQGSVIAAWLLGVHGLGSGHTVHLITCGSPLHSLYATFFPAHFGPGFFRRTSDRSVSASWLNVWRPTDPIATPMPATAIGVNEVRIDESREPLKCHGHYWTEEQLTTYVAAKLGHPGSTRVDIAPAGDTQDDRMAARGTTTSDGSQDFAGGS